DEPGLGFMKTVKAELRRELARFFEFMMVVLEGVPAPHDLRRGEAESFLGLGDETDVTENQIKLAAPAVLLVSRLGRPIDRNSQGFQPRPDEFLGARFVVGQAEVS